MLRASCVLPQTPADCTSHVEELRQLAGEVRRIGCGYRSDPETIAVAKSEIAARLVKLARELEVQR
ncbi:hypothetical protein [Aquibaculum sediminis]|uniref:hypothetical protein n=1 Tax=Aquibaculum sediminis TaxID=3231907 RepID=UPI0034537374